MSQETCRPGEVIGDALARGLVRHALRESHQRIERALDKSPKPGANRFGSYLRSACHMIDMAFGDAVIYRGVRKKGAIYCLLAPADKGAGFYACVMGVVFAKSREPRIVDLPIIITNHFAQRFLQDARIELPIGLKDTLFCMVIFRAALVKALGPIWIYHSLGLMICSIEAGEDDEAFPRVTFKTFISSAKLDPDKLRLWQRLKLETGEFASYRPVQKTYLRQSLASDVCAG